MTETGAARRSDPQTSHAAAASMAATLPDLHRLVYNAVLRARWHGRTAEEVSDEILVDKQSVTPRFATLQRRRLISLRLNEDGTPMTRTNRSGRQAQVWVTNRHYCEDLLA